MSAPVRLAVLASGGGTNLQAILDHLDAAGERRRAEVVLVASDRAAAGALERARARGIAAAVIDPDDAAASDQLLADHRVQLVALAGFLRFVPVRITERFRGRIVNVHPSLLPAFGGRGMYGRRVHESVIRAGARVTGVTVHFVDAQYDHGPIIAQWPVPVQPDDDADALAQRVLKVEHLLYPSVIDAVAAGSVRLETDGRVTGGTMNGNEFQLDGRNAGLRSSESREPRAESQ